MVFSNKSILVFFNRFLDFWQSICKWGFEDGHIRFLRKLSKDYSKKKCQSPPFFVQFFPCSILLERFMPRSLGYRLQKDELGTFIILCH